MQTHKRVLLTSFVALGFVYPAVAVPEYQIPAGKYLPAGETVVADCISGYWCPGLDNLVSYSETNDQGLNACSSGYTSDSGASSAGQCYRTCSYTAPVASMTGNDYYGFSADTCTVDSCVAGWHVANQGSSFSPYLDASSLGDRHAVSSSYVSGGQYYNIFSSGYYPPENSENSESSGVDSGWYEDSAVELMQYDSFYDMAAEGEWAVCYGIGSGLDTGCVRGTARLSENSGVAATSSAPPTLRTTQQLGNEGGTNCYCNITGYKVWLNPTVSNANSQQWKPATSSWAYSNTGSSVGNCAIGCAGYMAENDSMALSFRTALVGSMVASSSLTCVANTITINWNGVGGNQAADGTTISNYSADDHTGNTSVAYGSRVVTPRTAWAPVGKRFKGWRFVASGGGYTK